MSKQDGCLRQSSSAARTCRFSQASMLLFLLIVAAVGCKRGGFAEVHFSTAESIESGIDKGWLPRWLPSGAKNLRGVQETFDSDFVWLSLNVDPELRSIVQTNCDERDRASAGLPGADFMARFPSDIVEEYRHVSSEAMAHYACANPKREFLVAIDSVGRKAYLWSH